MQHPRGQEAAHWADEARAREGKGSGKNKLGRERKTLWICAMAMFREINLRRPEGARKMKPELKKNRD